MQYHKKRKSQRTHFILDNQSVQDSVNDPSIAVSENRSLHEVNMIILFMLFQDEEISYWGGARSKLHHMRRKQRVI